MVIYHLKLGGLNLTQWLISIGLGSLSLIVNILLKIVNEEQLCPEVNLFIFRLVIKKKIQLKEEVSYH